MEKQYTISEVAKMFHMQTSTLRYYEEIGILTNIQRTSSGKRIYFQKHVNRLKTICCFKHTGMSIANLQKFFSYGENETGNIKEIIKLLLTQKEQVKKQLEELQNDYTHVERKLAYYSDMQKALNEHKPLPNWQDYKQK